MTQDDRSAVSGLTERLTDAASSTPECPAAAGEGPPGRGASRGGAAAGWFAVERWRVAPVAVGVLMLVGATYFVRVVNKLSPLAEWQSFHFLGYGLATGAWMLGCLSFGLRVDGWLRPGLRLSEQLVMALTTGVVGSAWLLFLLGRVGLLWGPVFVVLPLAMMASGAEPSWRLGRRVARHVSAVRRRRSRPDTVAEHLGLWFGVIGVLLVLVPTLTVDHLGFDSGWYHVSMAEHYAATHRMDGFAEGWLLGAYPHLSSVLYTWAALCPWGTAVDRTMLSGMVEVGLFAATLACMPVLVRTLTGRRVRHAWAALFLFPIMFNWNLEIGADHVAGFFAVPVMLGFLRHEKAPGAGRGVVLAVAIAGALLTKYSAYPMVVFPMLAVAAGGVWRGVRAALTGGGVRAVWGRGLRGAVGVWLAVLVLTTPHWLANLVFYGDPLYPSLHRWLPPRPWTPTSAYLSDLYMHTLATVHPPRTAAGLLESFKAMAGFSFEAFDYWQSHRDWPFIGSVFTIVTLTLPLLGARRRVWLVFASLYVTLFGWHAQSHVERYLHAALPVFAVATSAALVLIWGRGLLARLATVLVVGVQLLWGVSIFGLANFQYKVKSAMNAAERSYLRDDRDLAYSLRPWMDISKTLPRRARVLLHEIWMHVGLERASVSDVTGAQSGIAYGLMPSPRALHDRLTEMHITHLVSFAFSREDDSIGGDLRYFDYERRFGQTPRKMGEYRVSAMPLAAPPEEPDWGLVYVHTCKDDDPYAAGLHDLSALNRAHLGGHWHGSPPRPLELAAADPARQVNRARFAVVRAECGGRVPGLVDGRLAFLIQRGPYKLYGPR